MATAFLICSIVAGAAPEPTHEEQIQEILRLSGLNGQIEELVRGFHAQLAGRQEEIDPEIFEILQEVFGATYRVDALKQSVSRVLRGESEDRNLTPVLVWLRGPVAVEMTRRELEASAPDSEAKIMEYAMHLKDQSPPPQRLQLIKDIDSAAGSSEAAVQMVLQSFTSLSKGMSYLRPGTPAMSAREARELRQRLETQIRPTLHNSTLISLLYMYRDMEDDALRSYLDFARSADGKWLLATTVQSLLRAVEDVGKQSDHLFIQQAKELRDRQ